MSESETWISKHDYAVYSIDSPKDDRVRFIEYSKYQKAIEALHFAFSGIQHFDKGMNDADQRAYMNRYLAKVLLELGEL
jgi:hypothetical protein